MSGLNMIEQYLGTAMQIPGQTWPRELLWLYQRIESLKFCMPEGRQYRHLEAGVFCGRSLYIAAMAIGSGHITTVDAGVFPHIDNSWVKDVYEATLRLLPKEIEVTTLSMVSDKAAIEPVHAGGYDSVFIDGDHRHAGVINDIHLWYPMVRIGGTICGHDYWTANAGVMAAVNESFKQFEVVEGSRVWHLEKTGDDLWGSSLSHSGH